MATLDTRCGSECDAVECDAIIVVGRERENGKNRHAKNKCGE